MFNRIPAEGDVPNLWDNMPDAPPQSELNPLTNPTLERNLGRWAQVYFSNPPGKREQAVSALLEEIRRETRGDSPAHGSRSYFPDFQGVVCSTCQHKNTLRHTFCGQCGAALNPPASDARKDKPFARIQVPVEASSKAQYDSDVQWLRDKSLSHMDAADGMVWRGWKYLVGGAVLALIVFAYLQWAPRGDSRTMSSGRGSLAIAPSRTASSSTAKIAPRASVPQAPVENSPATRRPSEALPPNTELSPVPNVSEHRVVENSAATRRPSEAVPPNTELSRVPSNSQHRAKEDVNAVPAGLQSAVRKSSLPVAFPSQTGDGPENGIPDLQLAERYLGGGMGVRDSSVAAKLLWKAVRKENTAAAVLLSDLYMRGDGVPKSCDQARLLLVAAAKRGATQAAQQLRSLELRGCR
jgi:hypothetical protein